MSVGHSKAFSTRRGRPAYLAPIALDITSTWVDALSSLSDEVLVEKLGDVLDKRRISALAKRRDSLLEEAAN